MTNDMHPYQVSGIKAVKDFATEHYGKDGWDIVIETMSDEDIFQIIWRARTDQGAINKMAAHLEAPAAYRAEIIAEAGEPALIFRNEEMASYFASEAFVTEVNSEARANGWA